MLVTDAGSEIAFRLIQLLKAELPIVVRAFPKKVTVANAEQKSNARSAILVTVLGMVIDCKLIQL